MKRLVALGLVVLMVLGGSVIAVAEGESGTTDITATVGGWIEIEVEDSSLEWALEIKEDNRVGTSVKVSANVAWDLAVAASNDGYFSSGDNELQNALQVSTEQATGYQSLEAGSVTLRSGQEGVPAGTDVPVYFQQAVDKVDAAGDYTITITYTAQQAID